MNANKETFKQNAAKLIQAKALVKQSEERIARERRELEIALKEVDRYTQELLKCNTSPLQVIVGNETDGFFAIQSTRVDTGKDRIDCFGVEVVKTDTPKKYIIGKDVV